MRRFARTALIVASAGAAFGAAGIPPVAAQPPEPGTAYADAYTLEVDVTAATLVPVQVGPLNRATQDCPPTDPAPATETTLSVGPIPESGALVQKAETLASSARADCTNAPVGIAVSQTEDVELLPQGGVPQITADLLRAQANANCVDEPNADGSLFVNLRVGSVTVPANPDPNERIDLGFATVIVNEQQPAARGRGIVVNSLHIIGNTDLFRGDIIVSHANAGVGNCPNGAGSTGQDTVIKFAKTATPTSADPGDLVTYRATVRNTGDDDCLINEFVDHLAPVFQFVSTAGPLGDEATTSARPDGGIDVTFEPEDVTIEAGQSVEQTIVVRVTQDADPGTYSNNLEIFCAELGNFVSGPLAPVTIPAEDAPDQNRPGARPEPECSDGDDNDGDGKIDFPDDPGCESREDDDERDQVTPRAAPDEPTLAITGGGFLPVVGGLLLLTGAVVLRRRAVRD